jgi:hypothetical protein
MKRLIAAACLATAGLAVGGIHSASAASTTGGCVGQVTSGLNSDNPGSGGQNNALFAHLTQAGGTNFGQAIAAHDAGCVGP